MTASIHFFTDSNGPVPTSYYASNFGGLRRNVRFSGYPHAVLQGLLAAVCLRAERESTPVQVVHNCLDNSMQGVILPELSAGAFGFDAADRGEHNILALLGDPDLCTVQENLSAAHKTFLRARAFHDEQEKVYLAHMDFNAVDRLTDQTIRQLLGDKSGTRAGKEIHRFFGAATIDGNLDYIPEVTADLPRRFFIKGRPGTGKSTFLKKVAAAALRRGCTVETYHCSLDPKSLDLIAVRELGFCLLDSTSPHEYFPSREGDEIIDVYAECVDPGTDEAYAEELRKLQKSYKDLVQSAVGYLREARQAQERWEASLPEPDPSALEQTRERLLSELFAD